MQNNNTFLNNVKKSYNLTFKTGHTRKIKILTYHFLQFIKAEVLFYKELKINVYDFNL